MGIAGRSIWTGNFPDTHSAEIRCPVRCPATPIMIFGISEWRNTLNSELFPPPIFYKVPTRNPAPNTGKA